jgi:hypothetical protein
MKSRDLDNIMMDIYRDLYRNSEPAADFDELVANADLDEFGRKDIHFMDYEITQENLDRIIEEHLVKHKLSGPRIRSISKKYDAQKIRNTIYLGCSPRTKTEKK